METNHFLSKEILNLTISEECVKATLPPLKSPRVHWWILIEGLASLRQINRDSLLTGLTSPMT